MEKYYIGHQSYKDIVNSGQDMKGLINLLKNYAGAFVMKGQIYMDLGMSFLVCLQVCIHFIINTIER
jgi:hypothetical protein